MSKFDDFTKKYDEDQKTRITEQVALAHTLGCIDTKLEGIGDFKTAVTEHEVKIKGHSKQIKGIWATITAFVVMVGTIIGRKW